MRLEEFDFELPDELIAQAPPPRREDSRLLVLDRRSGVLAHRMFPQIVVLVRPGDLLIVNDAKVIPARLLGRKRGTGGKVQLLLVRPVGSSLASAAIEKDLGELEWICLGQASKGLRAGTCVELEDGITAQVTEEVGGGELRVRFAGSKPQTLLAVLERAGRIPLPPYITRPPSAEDAVRYQTVYAKSPGSVAAPTAGLHFTPELFAALKARGVRWAEVTLDVGPGTFLPIRDGDLGAHKMHAERYQVPADTAALWSETRRLGGRVIAVGMTVVRTLESAFDSEREALTAGTGDTTLFIRPGFEFKAVDVLVTNFHLPKSTLVLLVSAFAGKEPLFNAYREAVKQRYRFFSYGDAMWIG